LRLLRHADEFGFSWQAFIPILEARVLTPTTWLSRCFVTGIQALLIVFLIAPRCAIFSGIEFIILFLAMAFSWLRWRSCCGKILPSTFHDALTCRLIVAGFTPPATGYVQVVCYDYFPLDVWAYWHTLAKLWLRFIQTHRSFNKLISILCRDTLLRSFFTATISSQVCRAFDVASTWFL
jgi:hypothetical protein